MRYTLEYGTSGANPTVIGDANAGQREHVIDQTSFAVTNAGGAQNPNRVTVRAGSNEPFGTPDHVRGGDTGARTDFAYDPFKRLRRVNRRPDSSAFGAVVMFNAIGYDALGRIGSAGDSTGLTYGFDYNLFGDLTDYTMTDASGNRQTMLRKRYDYNMFGSSEVTETFNPERADASELVSQFDAYGRPVHINSGQQSVSFTYQDSDASFAESPGAAQVAAVSDPFSGESVVYRYNEENLPCGYEVIGGGSLKQTVTQTGHGRTRYTLGFGSNAETFETEAEYDEDVAGNPRIAAARLYTLTNPHHGDQELEHYTVGYRYDRLGRLARKEQQLPFRPNLNASNDAVYRYMPGTTLAEEIRATYRHNGSNRTDRIIYRYDGQANVLSSTETFSSEEPAAHTHTTLTRSFAYDAHGRVEREIYFRNNVVDSDRSYEYTYAINGAAVSRNRVERIIDNRVGVFTRRLIYNTFGQLTDAGNGTGARAYDHYGNCTRIGGTDLTYTRGHLLSSYGNRSYVYNQQGVRTQRTENGVTARYYVDGAKLLGEDRCDGVRLRYIYDACGLLGVRYWPSGGLRYSDFLYQKDALGNIVGLAHAGDLGYTQVCRYVYTAFGACTVLNPDGTAASFAAGHIARVNPLKYLLRSHKNT